MFTPENLKKLTNVSIVTLKKHNKRYELAVYPNKLYEYKKGITKNTSEILHTNSIFKDVSKGELANTSDLKLFNLPNSQIIEEILNKGTERKHKKTRDFENQKAENEIIKVIGKSIVTKDNKYLSPEVIRKYVSQIGISELKDPKVQAKEIIKILVEKNREFKKIKMKVEVFGKVNDDFINEFKEFIDDSYCKLEDKIIVYVESESFIKFKELLGVKGYKFVILSNDPSQEEEIC